MAAESPPKGEKGADQNKELQEQKQGQKGLKQKKALQELIVDPKSIFDESGKLLTPKNAVWSKLSEEIAAKKLPMSPKHIYVFCNSNRHNLLTELCIAAGFKLPAPVKDDSDSGGEEEVERPQGTFKAILSAEEWEEIRPLKREVTISGKPGSTRTIFTLPPNAWAHVLFEVFCLQQDITCPFVFKRATVKVNFSSKEKYVTFDEGKCHECGGTATAWIDVPPEKNEPVTVFLRATDSRKIVHKTTRQLRGTQRARYKKSSKTAEEIRRDLARKFNTAGNSSVLTVFSAEVLRKALQQGKEELFKEMGIPIGPDVFSCLLDMKNTQPFVGSIHIACPEPVCVIYNTPSQQLISRDLCKRRYSKISIDATGNCASRIVTERRRSRNIFLYQVVGQTDEDSVPLNQMLSERHHANIILFWLNEGIRRKFGMAKEVVCDDSPALLIAVARSIAECASMTSYLKQCFDVLSGKKDQLPRCFIRIDIAHFNRSATKWKFWTQYSRLVKDHLLRWLGLLTKSTSVQDFADTLSAIFVVVLSQTCSEDSDVAQCKNKLIQMVSGQSQSDTENGDQRSGNEDHEESESEEEDEMDEDDLSDIGEVEEPSIKEWVNELYTQAVITSKQEEPESAINAYYSPDFAKALKRLAPRFILWTAVMVKHFKSPYDVASSARSESQFHSLKSGTFKGIELPTSINKFVGVHLLSIEGQVSLAAANLPCKTSNEDQLNRSERELDETEDWMGQSSQDKKPAETKSKYLSNYPPIEIETKMSVLHDPRDFLLRNGNLTSYQIVQSGERAMVSNTCAFDSFIQIIAVCVLDQPDLRPFIEECASTSPAMKVGWMLAHEGAAVSTFEERLKTLIPLATKSSVKAPKISKKSQPLRIRRYDLEGNAQLLLDKLELGFSSIRVTFTCANDHQVITFNNLLTVNENILDCNGIQSLGGCIVTRKSQDCRNPKCQEKALASDTETGRIVIIDCSCKSGRKFKLGDVPISIKFNGNEFQLLGVIAYKPGHYVSYARRLQGHWELYNDVNRHPYRAKPNKLVHIEVAIYFR